MEKEENLNQENASKEPSEENNKPEDQTEKVEESSSTEEKKEISLEEKIYLKQIRLAKEKRERVEPFNKLIKSLKDWDK